MTIETENMDVSMEQNNKKKKSMMPLLKAATVGMLIVAVSGMTSFFLVNGSIPLDMETMGSLEETRAQGDPVQSTEEAVVKTIQEAPKDRIESRTDGRKLLVAVPTEEMSLRKTPGFTQDIITKVYAGTYLLWEGEKEVVDGADFYKVTLRDTGETGYLAGKYCVRVEFPGNENELSVVNVATEHYTYDEMAADIRRLCEVYPDRLKSMEIGKSADGRIIYAVILGNPDAPRKVMVQAAIHGREYMTSQLVMKMLEHYAFYYDDGSYGSSTYRELFEETSFYVVPMANPDGVTISQLGTKAIRDKETQALIEECYRRDRLDSNSEANGKSFEEYQSIWKANANGVDLNKNFDAGWEAVGRKKLPSYENYKGGQAGSEPESQALASFAKSQDFLCFLNYHSKGQIIYYGAKGSGAENSAASGELAKLLGDKVRYLPVNTVKNSNVSLGGFGDWAQLKLDKPSVTIETGKNDCPLEIGEFPAMWFRNRESWAYLCGQLR